MASTKSDLQISFDTNDSNKIDSRDFKGSYSCSISYNAFKTYNIFNTRNLYMLQYNIIINIMYYAISVCRIISLTYFLTFLSQASDASDASSASGAKFACTAGKRHGIAGQNVPEEQNVKSYVNVAGKAVLSPRIINKRRNLRTP